MIKFFAFDERVDVPEDFDISYLQHLHDRGKIVKRERGVISLRDFSGYIGETLYIPQKLELLLQLQSDSEYKELFTNLFSAIISEFREDILFQLFPTRFGLKESGSKPSPIFQLNTLLKYRDSTVVALRRIANNPHRRLVENMVYKPFQDVAYVDETIMIDIIQHPQSWYDDSPKHPMKALQYNNFESVDTIENRFIKKFIVELLQLVYHLMDYVKVVPVQRILLNGLKSEIENFLLDFPVDEIGELRIHPYNSQVLLKRSGYRELFYLYNRLNYSFTPSFFESLDNAISIKDISSLWEYYVMTKLISQFGEIEKQSYEENLRVRDEVYDRAYIKFKSGLVLKYQYVIYSYSQIPFRPDFYIEYRDKRYVIDAKFRVLGSNRTEIMKNMHYYKDGLQLESAVAVVIDNKRGGEFYSQRDGIEVIDNFDDIFSRDGIGYLSLNLLELLK